MKDNNKRYSTTFYTDKNMKIEASKIAKIKGVNTLNGLLNILLAEYIEKHRNLLEREER